MNEPPRDWNARYVEGNTPWDSGLPSRELARVLDERAIPPGRAVELGCGTGTNAVYLAQRGFDVTATDVSAIALERARSKADEAGVNVAFLEADVCRLGVDVGEFDFLFDRGCYHCVRRVDLDGYRRALARLTVPGSVALVLTGNANEPSEEGIPRVQDVEIREELGDLFNFEQIRAFHFEDAGGRQGPLGWSCLMIRKDVR